MASRQGFERLRHQTLCDGRGLKARQAFRPPYAVRNAGEWTVNPQLQGDEEIEVFVYNVTCDEADALPCRKCQVPVCEECRCYPRAAPPTAYPNRRPHLKSSLELWNIMALCTACDAEAERDVEGKFLNELCDCDRYTRWVCLPCYEAEQRFVEKYFDECTKMEFDWDGLEFDEDEEEGPSKCMTDHQFDRAFWCLCGAKVDQETRFRCTWCKRRHLHEDEWHREFQEVGSKLPFFDNNPDYPRWTSDGDQRYPKPYPSLGYIRPGDGIVATL